MSFYEVAEALTLMQERTGHQAEIIPGLMTDDRLQDRCQVILIITGLGGHSVRERFPCPSRLLSNPSRCKPRSWLTSRLSPTARIIRQRERNNALTNLDMPAFIRRRYRTNG